MQLQRVKAQLFGQSRLAFGGTKVEFSNQEKEDAGYKQERR
jgi:hypothetical protein